METTLGNDELLVAIRTEWKATHDAVIQSGDANKAELLTKFEKVSTDLNAKADANVAAIKADAAATIETKFRRWAEANAQLPGGSTTAVAKSLGATFVEHADVNPSLKGGTFGRKDRLVATMNQRMLPAEGKVITGAGSGFVLYPQRVGIFPAVPAIPLAMRDLFTVIPLGPMNTVEYLVETFTNNADYQVLEGDKKAESTVAYTEKTASVKTIAHFVKISRQMMADVPYVASTIDDRLIFGVLKKEDQELLTGNNAAGHLFGVLPQATALGGLTVASVMLDEIFNAITAVANAGYSATNIVMNPSDWGAMQVLKNAMGVYFLGGPTMIGGARLWGLPVTTTPIIPAKTSLVGQFPATAAIFDRETATVDIAYENEDDFIKNLVCIRAEERLAFAVFNPQAYVKVVIP